MVPRVSKEQKFNLWVVLVGVLALSVLLLVGAPN